MDKIPLFDQSLTYARRLDASTLRVGLPTYYHRRLVNYRFRYDDRFRDHELLLFARDPKGYIEGGMTEAPKRGARRFMEARVALKARFIAVLKVLAHWAFRLLGRRPSYRRGALHTRARRCYVEVSEKLFGGARATRLVYPFPLNPRRQWQYLRTLRGKGDPYSLMGLSYSAADLGRFLKNPTYRNLIRLESRANLRHAQELLDQGFTEIECTDEYDPGSLDFCRRFRRGGGRVHNASHGVGTYLPYHAYSIFSVLLENQIRYYRHFCDTHYQVRCIPAPPTRSGSESRARVVVFLGQYQKRLSMAERDIEQAILDVLCSQLDEPEVALFYKPHPNATRTGIDSRGARVVQDNSEFGPYGNRLFISSFSTCYIDPAFQGDRVLVASELIRPEIVFGQHANIIELEELGSYVTKWVVGQADA